MTNITVERYRPTPPEHIPADRTNFVETTDYWSGLIEGTAKDGVRWIIYLDENERPSVYWPKRDEDGAAIGEPIHLPVSS